MPRHKTGLDTGQVLRAGGRKTKADARYAAGWLVLTDRPGEDLIHLGSSVYSIMYVGAETRNIYKTIKRTKEWFRFSFIASED